MTLEVEVVKERLKHIARCYAGSETQPFLARDIHVILSALNRCEELIVEKDKEIGGLWKDLRHERAMATFHTPSATIPWWDI